MLTVLGHWKQNFEAFQKLCLYIYMQTKEPAVRLFPLFDIRLCYCPEASEWPAIRVISPPVIKTTCVHVDVVLLHYFPTLHQTANFEKLTVRVDIWPGTNSTFDNVTAFHYSSLLYYYYYSSCLRGCWFCFQSFLFLVYPFVSGLVSTDFKKLISALMSF